MAERRVLTDDARMLSMAEPTDAARDSEMVSHRCNLVGVEQTVVCGLDVDARKEPIGFAACLARRLGWQLALVPLPEPGTQDERFGRLLAACKRDRAGFVVTEAARSRAGAAALVELSRGAACPVIAVPRGAAALGTGPILCGVARTGPAGTAALAASQLANAIGTPLRLVDLALDEGKPARRLGELAGRTDAPLLAVAAPRGDGASPDGVVAAVLRDSQVPVMLVPGDAAIPRAHQAA
jgi:hypothetical protein